MSKYSIVVPAYNEEATLRLFYEATVPAFETLNEEFEIIFVNDGSTDRTQEILAELAKQDARVKVCRFSRNFGQQAALLCGMQQASGEAVIAMDADLQDSPETALAMIEKWKEGYEVVHGKRRTRKGESAFKKRTADLFYSLTRKITGLNIPSNVGDFKLYDRKVVNAILSMGEHDRLLRTQTAWVGFKQTFVEFDRPERIAGKSHYTLKKMTRLAQSGILPNTEAGLTFPIKLGLFFGFASVACLITFIVLTCLGISFGGLTAWLFPTIGLVSTITLICQGIANLHTAMIYREVQNRPKYIIAETLNLE
ncbi:MAG: glycosyltransferase family 2 protein [Clostridia bacterium]|nr:glycosyltransferase family 2 protein [Clostridia bacterium]